MKSRYARFLTALAFGLVIGVGRPASIEASPITITNVMGTIGPSGGPPVGTYTAARVGWTFPYTLNTGQDLVRAQRLHGRANATDSYSFDTRDIIGPYTPQISVTVNGVV